MSGSYSINGTELIDQPTVGRWIPKELLGVAGSAQPMYPGVREFEMSWNLISPEGYNQIQGFYNNASGVFPVTVGLPIYANAAFVFQNYSGCTMQEPSFGDEYFAGEGYVPNVRLVIMRILNQ
jgi:hypothetical protein